jgi:hypothetical protein
MFAIQNKAVAQKSAAAAENTPIRGLADVMRMAKRAECEAGNEIRELSIADLGRVGGGSCVGNNI